jgi:dynein heavy chain
VVALRTEGMKERHWEILSEKVGFEVKPHEGFTFKDCMQMKLTDFSDAIQDIGERAGKEFMIESQMAKMKNDWTQIELGLKPFKNTGTYSVIGFDEAMQMLEEHIVLTQAMQFSSFKMPFEEEIEEWNTKLL